MIAHDLRFAVRAVARSPGFAATVVLTLALGIGANAAIFELISAIHVRTLPVRNPNELAEIRIAGGTDGSDEQTACPASTAVASYRFWQIEMGGRPLDATSRLLINGDWHQIVGITPPGFSGLIVGDTFDLALPLCRPAEMPRHVFDLTVMGRLRPGWTIERASAHVDSISAGIFDATTPSGYSAQSTARFPSTGASSRLPPSSSWARVSCWACCRHCGPLALLRR